MIRAALCIVLCGAWSCGYYHYAGPLQPASEQPESIQVLRDGVVTYGRGGLSIGVRAMSETELNRLYTSSSTKASSNPYTFANTVLWDGDRRTARFTVFRVIVKNDEYPKIKIDPSRMVIRCANGREYWSLGSEQLDSYFRAYAIGYRGNEYALYQERRDLLRRTMMQNEEIFTGQSEDKYVVFPALDPDVEKLNLVMADVALRFDYMSEPLETVDLEFGFRRDLGKMYGDGRVVLESSERPTD